MATDPEDEELGRRSRAPALGPWVVLALIAMAALAAYVVSAVTP